nr:MAG TPA: hypothetical protein [Caudoviricetes sp.]
MLGQHQLPRNYPIRARPTGARGWNRPAFCSCLSSESWHEKHMNMTITGPNDRVV